MSKSEDSMGYYGDIIREWFQEIQRAQKPLQESLHRSADHDAQITALNLEFLAAQDERDRALDDADLCRQERDTARESAAMHRAAFDAVRETMLDVIGWLVPITRRLKKKHTTKDERRKLYALDDMLAKATDKTVKKDTTR